MSEFNVGDLVEARRGESVIRGRLKMVDGDCELAGVGWGIDALDRNGFTLSLVEAATPPLPTEAGHYEDRLGRYWLHQIYDGSSYGCPDRDVDQWLDPNGKIAEFPENGGPFTRLESVPVTAKKVLERVTELLRGIDLPNEFSGLAREFGVQS